MPGAGVAVPAPSPLSHHMWGQGIGPEEVGFIRIFLQTDNARVMLVSREAIRDGLSPVPTASMLFGARSREQAALERALSAAHVASVWAAVATGAQVALDARMAAYAARARAALEHCRGLMHVDALSARLATLTAVKQANNFVAGDADYTQWKAELRETELMMDAFPDTPRMDELRATAYVNYCYQVLGVSIDVMAFDTWESLARMPPPAKLRALNPRLRGLYLALGPYLRWQFFAMRLVAGQPVPAAGAREGETDTCRAYLPLLESVAVELEGEGQWLECPSLMTMLGMVLTQHLIEAERWSDAWAVLERTVQCINQQPHVAGVKEVWFSLHCTALACRRLGKVVEFAMLERVLQRAAPIMLGNRSFLLEDDDPGSFDLSKPAHPVSLYLISRAEHKLARRSRQAPASFTQTLAPSTSREEGAHAPAAGSGLGGAADAGTEFSELSPDDLDTVAELLGAESTDGGNDGEARDAREAPKPRGFQAADFRLDFAVDAAQARMGLAWEEWLQGPR